MTQDKDDEIVNDWISKIIKVYYDEVRRLAGLIVSEVQENIEENNAESDEDITEKIDEYINKYTEDSEWVFVNHLARITAVVSDNRDELFDTLDGYTEKDNKECTHDNTRAFWAFKKDLEEQVQIQWDNLKK